MPIHPGEIAVAGTVTVTAKVNLRQGAPSRISPVAGKRNVGDQLSVAGIASGDEVQGNRLWFRLADDTFVWSGACGPFTPGAVAAPPAAPALVPPAVPQVSADFPAARIVDLSHFNAVTSFDSARAAGVLGIIHKATTGRSGRDGSYPPRRLKAEAAGLLWGAYHFGTAAPVADQVANFLDWAAPDEHTLVALDFEESAGNQMSLEQAREFLQLIEEKLKRKAVLYSGNTIKEALKSTVDDYFGSHRLWLAQYSERPEPQASWDSAWLWQFTEGKLSDPRRRTVPGLPGNEHGELDCDHYQGTPEQLADEWAS